MMTKKRDTEMFRMGGTFALETVKEFAARRLAIVVPFEAVTDCDHRPDYTTIEITDYGATAACRICDGNMTARWLAP
jgi:hypothetical protein